MDSRRVRTIVGVAVAVLLFVGFGVGRLFGGVGTLTDGPRWTCDDPLPWARAEVAVGDPAAVVGTVAAASHEPDVGGAPTFLNLGNAHPDPDRFDVVIYEDARARFEEPPEQVLEGVEVCVQGRVRDRDGVPQIILEGPGMLTVTGQR